MGVKYRSSHVVLEPQVDIWILFDSSYTPLAHLENLDIYFSFCESCLISTWDDRRSIPHSLFRLVNPSEPATTQHNNVFLLLSQRPSNPMSF